MHILRIFQTLISLELTQIFTNGILGDTHKNVILPVFFLLVFVFMLRVNWHHRPMGVFEFSKFEAGTKAIMDAVVEATKGGATSIIGTM